MQKGLVQIFYGGGKGKTTSALGAALRASGSGMKVHIVQFMKNGASSLEEQIPSEIKSLEKIPNISFKRFGLGEWLKDKNLRAHKEKAEEALVHLQNSLKNFDMVIADEILYAVQLGLLSEDKIIQLIKSKPQETELILTGSHKPLNKIFELADLITEIKKVKHPFDSGIPARKGIEF